jgi:hypothetical protein
MQLGAAWSALYRIDGEIKHLLSINRVTPTSRQHARRGGTREERDGGHLTYRDERPEAVNRR